MEDAGGFGGRILVRGSLHVELKIIDNTSTQHPVFLDIPWAQKNMWLVTSYLSYRLNLYTTGMPNICWQQEYIYTRAGEDTGGFGDRNLGEEGWWSMHFHFITHAKSLKTTSVILPAWQKSRGFQFFKPNFYKWPWDWFLGVKKRFLRSLVKLGFKVSRSFLVKLEIEAVGLYKIHHGFKLQKTRCRSEIRNRTKMTRERVGHQVA